MQRQEEEETVKSSRVFLNQPNPAPIETFSYVDRGDPTGGEGPNLWPDDNNLLDPAYYTVPDYDPTALPAQRRAS